MRERVERPNGARHGDSIGRGGRDRGRGLGPIPALLRTGTKNSVFAAALLVVTFTLVAETDVRALQETEKTILYVGAPVVSVPTAREAGVIACSYEDEASPAVLAALGHDTGGGSDPLVEEALASVTAIPGEPDAVTADEAEDAGRVFLAQTGEGADEPADPAGTEEYASGGPVRPELGDGEETPEPAKEGAGEELRDPRPEEALPPPAGGPELASASTGVGGPISALPPEADPEPIELASSPATDTQRPGGPTTLPSADEGEISAPDDAIARNGPVPAAEQVPASMTIEEPSIDDGTGEPAGEPASATTVERVSDEAVEDGASKPPESPEETAHPGAPPAYTSERPEAPPPTDGEERVLLVVTPAEEGFESSEEELPWQEDAILASPPEDVPSAPEVAGERPPADGVQPPERPDARYPEETGEDSSDGDPGGGVRASAAQPGRAEAPSGAEGEPDNGLSEEGAPRPEAPAEAHLRNGDAETGASAPQTEPQDPIRRPDRPPAQLGRPPGSGGERPGSTKLSEERGDAGPGPAGRRDPGGHDGAPRGGSPERIIERIKRSDGGTAAVARRAARVPGIAAGRERGHTQTADGASAMAGAGRGVEIVVDETHHGRAGRETPHRTKESKATEEGA